MSQCPFIAKITPAPFNEPVVYRLADGGTYTFYRHDDGLGKISNVQFCERIGRKRDVFECLNENEWRNCYAYRSAMQSGPTPLATPNLQETFRDPNNTANCLCEFDKYERCLENMLAENPKRIKMRKFTPLNSAI